MPITLRPVAESDQDFLSKVYASTRRDEVSAWGWDVSQQDAFLGMQFTAQQRAYEGSETNRSHDIILLDIDFNTRAVLVDISWLPRNTVWPGHTQRRA